MGSAASIPETEEEALAQGYTARQIEEYKVLVVGLARQNALRALELRNQSATQSSQLNIKTEEAKEEPKVTQQESKDYRK